MSNLGLDLKDRYLGVVSLGMVVLMLIVPSLIVVVSENMKTDFEEAAKEARYRVYHVPLV